MDSLTLSVSPKSHGVIVKDDQVYFLSVHPELLVLNLDKWLAVVIENCREFARAHSSVGDLAESSFWLRKVAEIELFLVDRSTLSSLPLVALRQKLIADSEITSENIHKYVQALVDHYQVDLCAEMELGWVISTDSSGHFNVAFRAHSLTVPYCDVPCETSNDKFEALLSALYWGGERGGYPCTVKSIMGWAV